MQKQPTRIDWSVTGGNRLSNCASIDSRASPLMWGRRNRSLEHRAAEELDGGLRAVAVQSQKAMMARRAAIILAACT